MILGLDISTSITGFCVLDASGEIIRSGAWDTRNKNKFNSVFEKARFIKENLCEIKAQFPIEKVFIEQPFSFFNSGGSSAKTMATLQKFNGIISWLCYDSFNMEPVYINVNSARTLYGLSFPRGTKGPKRKKMVIESVIEKEKTAFAYEMARGGKNFKKGTDDRADAIVIARAGEFLLRNKDNEGFLTEKIVLVD